MIKKLSKEFLEKKAKELLAKGTNNLIPGTEDHDIALSLLRLRFPVLTDDNNSEFRLSYIKRNKEEIPFGYYYPDGEFPDDIPLKVDKKRKGEHGGESYCFYYKDPKNEFNSWEEFSYKVALLTQKGRRKRNIDKAFRTCIKDQIIDFKNKELAKPQNKTLKRMIEEGKIKIEIDHVIPFCRLLSDFLTQESQNIEDIELIPLYPEGYCFADKKIGEKWWLFHRENAILKIEDPEENRRKGAS